MVAAEAANMGILEVTVSKIEYNDLYLHTEE